MIWHHRDIRALSQKPSIDLEEHKQGNALAKTSDASETGELNQRSRNNDVKNVDSVRKK